jgi:hypothetical protein
VVTEPDGFKFRVEAAAPTDAAQIPSGLSNVTVAPPGQDYIEITVRVTNLQTDRPADLSDLIANGAGDAAEMVVPAACPNGASGNSCDVPADSLTPDGSAAISENEECGQCSQIQASQAVNLQLYALYPFPSTVPLSAIKLQFVTGTGAGTIRTYHVPLP